MLLMSPVVLLYLMSCSVTSNMFGGMSTVDHLRNVMSIFAVADLSVYMSLSFLNMKRPGKLIDGN